MLHLLDANVLITANRDYYPLERVPEYWEWLAHHAADGQVKMPIEMVEEIREGTDDLARWLSDQKQLDVLCLEEEADVALVQRVINEGYARDLTDYEVEKIGRDPFLISYALQARAAVSLRRKSPSPKGSEPTATCRTYARSCKCPGWTVSGF